VGPRRSEGELAAWRAVASSAGEPLVRAVGDGDLSVSAVARLRGRWPAEWVGAAIELVRARAKASVKWAGLESPIVSDVAGIEMASSEVAAGHKAVRVARAACGPVLDLCCGVGGDLMALRRAGVAGAGVDLDPLRAWMAEWNSGLPTRAADVTDEEVSGRVVHLDPARRDAGGRRTTRYADIEPGPAFVEGIVERSAGACIKLMPGVDPAELPEGEVEYVSESGRLTQAVLWTGCLTDRCGTRASLLHDTGLCSLVGDRSIEPPFANVGAFVYAADPSVERAGLLGELCCSLGLAMPHPRCGLLTSDQAVVSPWVRGYRVIDELPWSRKRARAAVRDAGGGVVVVKTRGGVVDADQESRALRGDGARELAVFIVRVGSAGVRCVLCSAVERDPRPEV
jgi:SAM-dependent methyltransferase